ncbi:hypothetical protein [Pseudomonas sp.]|jgi:hypothetical protein|uniref:hypothetical protein n=1 Tax=Pseudomonas sp. TaxID=306 RepID=UPI003D14B4A2
MNLIEHMQPLPTELLLAMALGEVDMEAVAARVMMEREMMSRSFTTDVDALWSVHG